jgi:hypothetical protein
MTFKPKEMFEVGDTVVLGESEREIHPDVAPFGKVVRSEDNSDFLCIKWESGQYSTRFTSSGQAYSCQIGDLVTNYGQDNDHLILALRLKL